MQVQALTRAWGLIGLHKHFLSLRRQNPLFREISLIRIKILIKHLMPRILQVYTRTCNTHKIINAQLLPPQSLKISQGCWKESTEYAGTGAHRDCADTHTSTQSLPSGSTLVLPRRSGRRGGREAAAILDLPPCQAHPPVISYSLLTGLQMRKLELR